MANDMFVLLQAALATANEAPYFGWGQGCVHAFAGLTMRLQAAQGIAACSIIQRAHKIVGYQQSLLVSC